jgi:glycosyltransferase involved in cell wall biosynthesis
MAGAVLALAGDPARRARLGAAARERVVTEDLTWSGNARRVLAAVEEVLR